jgi:hypothetical protein
MSERKRKRREKGEGEGGREIFVVNASQPQFEGQKLMILKPPLTSPRWWWQVWRAEGRCGADTCGLREAPSSLCPNTTACRSASVGLSKGFVSTGGCQCLTGCGRC